MKIFISSDHGGFGVKEKIVRELGNDYEIKDLGPYEINPDDDYPDYAKRVSKMILENPGSRGVLICRSGNGMAIAANKHKGIYASLCFGSRHARKAVEDDNSNICCLDADYEGEDEVEIAKAFIDAEFAGVGTRHERRFNKITALEQENFK